MREDDDDNKQKRKWILEDVYGGRRKLKDGDEEKAPKKHRDECLGVTCSQEDSHDVSHVMSSCSLSPPQDRDILCTRYIQKDKEDQV